MTNIDDILATGYPMPGELFLWVGISLVLLTIMLLVMMCRDAYGEVIE